MPKYFSYVIPRRSCAGYSAEAIRCLFSASLFPDELCLFLLGLKDSCLKCTPGSFSRSLMSVCIPVSEAFANASSLTCVNGAGLTYVTVRSFPVLQARAITVSAIFSSALHVHDISQIPGFLPLRLECTDTPTVTVIHVPDRTFTLCWF